MSVTETKSRPTERHLLHFDTGSSVAANEVLSFHLAGNDFPVQVHTEETRAEARRDNPLLAVFRDEELTHYVEAYAPSDAIAMGILHRRTTVDGYPCEVPLSLLISVPRAGRRHDAAEALRKNAVEIHPKLAVRAGANADPALVRLAMEKPDLLHDVVDPFETAAALLYQHPGLINLSVDKGGTIPSFILRKCIGDAINAKSTILNRISRKGPDWCRFVRLRDETGYIEDAEGPIFTMEIDDGVKNAMEAPLGLALKFSQQYMELQGQTWTQQYGRTSAADPRAATPQVREILRADQTKWTMKALSIEHGVNFHRVEYTEPVPGGWAIDAMWSADSKPNPMDEAFVKALAAGEAFVRVIASPGPPDGFRSDIPAQRIEPDKATTFRTRLPGLNVELRLDPMPTDLAVLVTRDPNAPQQPTLQGVRIGVKKNGKDEVLWTHDGSVANRGEIRIIAKNERLRHLSAYAEFFDSKGTAIQPGALAWLPPEVDKIFDAHPTKRYVDVIPPVDAVFGIPLPADWLTMKIPFPENAVKMRLYWGGLGTGAYDSTVCPAGITCTSVFELALPVMLLIAGAADYKTGFVNELLKDKRVLYSVIGVAVGLVGGSGVYIGMAQNPGAAAKTVAVKLGPVFGKILAKKGAEKFALYIARKYGEGAVKRAIPFVNAAFLAFDTAVTFAQLGQTIGAIAQSPFVYDVEITRSFDLAVKVKPDPKAGGIFPDYHDLVRVQVVYDTGAELKHVEKTDLPKGTIETPIDFTFAEAPAGGRMKVFVFFYAANGWQSARGESGWFDAKGENGTSRRQIEIVVKNALIPLSKSSVYKHLQSTKFENNKHVWKTGSAPAVTMASPSDPAHKLLSLNAITVALEPRAVGYAWQANGLGLPRDRALAPPTNDPLFVVQNISLGSDPSDGYAISPVGFSGQSGISYEIASGGDGTGMSFFIDPSRGEFDPQSNPGGGYHIRRVALSSSGKPQFNVASGQSWGRFPRPMDSFVYHPQGYICGITNEASKLYILKLPAAPVEDAKATMASLASGEGSRDGLMSQPRAIAVALDGRLLVLEAGNRRIQAFDYTGNPVPYFKSSTAEKSPVLALKDADKTTFLDLSVEAKGYIFVLGYTGDSVTAKADQYRVDIYEPDGTFLVSTAGVAAAKIAVDLARSMFTLNWETLSGPNGRTEPSVSKWLPPAPDQLAVQP